MPWPLWVPLLLLALVGNARIALFALNRLVFGEKHESNRMTWGLMLIPAAVLVLDVLFVPAWLWMERARPNGWGAAGIVWIALNALTGAYWLVDRTSRNLHPPIVEGVRSDVPLLIRLRRAHLPYRWLQKLGAHNDLYDLELTQHDVFIPDLPPPFDGYRIAFITDTHVAGFMRRAFYRTLLEQVMHTRPELVLFGGDFVTWRRHIPLMAELLTAGLHARDGMYAVLGNHDYWADADGVVAALTARGVRFIVNRSVEITRDGSVIDLAGIDELYRGEPDIGAAFRSVPGHRPCIAVSHHPDIIDRMGERRVDLLVCGHTHGGQIRLPFLGAIVVPSIHEGRYAAGFFRQRNVLMYVSRGLGSVPPVRILCRPEAPIFTLRRGSITSRAEPEVP